MEYSVTEETDEVLTITDRMYQRDEIWINKRLARQRIGTWVDKALAKERMESDERESI